MEKLAIKYIPRSPAKERQKLLDKIWKHYEKQIDFKILASYYKNVGHEGLRICYEDSLTAKDQIKAFQFHYSKMYQEIFN